MLEDDLIDDGFVNSAPVADDDTATTAEDGSVQINLLANDSDPDSDSLVATDWTVDTPHGMVIQISDSTVEYEPDEDFNGTDSFTYTVSDGATPRVRWLRLRSHPSTTNRWRSMMPTRSLSLRSRRLQANGSSQHGRRWVAHNGIDRDGTAVTVASVDQRDQRTLQVDSDARSGLIEP